MALDSPGNRLRLIAVFPDLESDKNFKILSECNNVYNCIAWAMGYDDRWVAPFRKPGFWWPKGAQFDMSPAALVQAFIVEGFELCDSDAIEDGYSKVVLYKNPTLNEWTHAARVIACGIEYSKFGGAWDGLHSHNVLCRTGLGYESQSYGVAYAYMRRKGPADGATKVPNGNISINLANLSKLRARLKK